MGEKTKVEQDVSKQERELVELLEGNGAPMFAGTLGEQAYQLDIIKGKRNTRPWIDAMQLLKDMAERGVIYRKQEGSKVLYSYTEFPKDGEGKSSKASSSSGSLRKNKMPLTLDDVLDNE